MRENRISGYQFRSELAKLCPSYAIDKDLDGQIVIYTGLREVEGDHYATWEPEGECDTCGSGYDPGSQLDHCADCGNCWSHCDKKVNA